MRGITYGVVVIAGVFLTAEVQRDTITDTGDSGWAEPLAETAFLASYSHGALTVTGTSTSADHEAALRQLVAEQFPDVPAEFGFRPGVLADESWEKATTRLVYLVSSMESARAHYQGGSVDVRGVTSAPDAFASRVLFLRESLHPDAELTTDIVVLKSSATLGELCERAFASLDLESVSFHESSAQLRQASLVALDRMTEFARDCQSARIAITGHSDASGNEDWNRRLSEARAQAVADHIIGNGIDPSRLIVTGLGSSQPIADNSTRRGREKNRRIEFELR